jgi:ABC-type uncharacterized transport system permease subunit
MVFGVLVLTPADQSGRDGPGADLVRHRRFGLRWGAVSSARRWSAAAIDLSRCCRSIPFIGPLLFRFDAMVYLSLALVVLIGWVLARTRLGLVILRAVGENRRTAPTRSAIPVIALRYGSVLFGGALAGLGGAYLSLALTPMWVEGMTAGRGWIALAQVVFATWKPTRRAARRLSVRRGYCAAVPRPRHGAGDSC